MLLPLVAAIKHGLSNARVEAINTQMRLITRRAFEPRRADLAGDAHPRGLLPVTAPLHDPRKGEETQNYGLEPLPRTEHDLLPASEPEEDLDEVAKRRAAAMSQRR